MNARSITWANYFDAELREHGTICGFLLVGEIGDIKKPRVFDLERGWHY